MNVRTLIWQELRHRKLNFALATVAVIGAAAVLVGAVTLLAAHDLATERALAGKRQLVAERTKQLEDDMRKITKKMGFNVAILPKDQNLSDLYADDYASRYMPESYAAKLAGSTIVTINHILPSLEQRVRWPEQSDRTIILIGIRGQLPGVGADGKKPIMEPVPPGGMVLGSELAGVSGLKVGDTARLMGRDFKVSQVHEPRGDKQDITAWIELKTAQEMLDKPGLINTIWALECECAFTDLPKIRQEITNILPETQVIEKGTIALARAEARTAAADEAKKSLEHEEAARAQLRRQRELLAAVMAPLVIAAAAVWVGLLTLANARERRAEIGLLRALGMRSGQIMAMFLGKALIIGLLGAAVGYLLGFTLTAATTSSSGAGGGGGELFDPALLIAVLIIAPALAAIGAWLPALAAAQHDPATILREE